MFSSTLISDSSSHSLAFNRKAFTCSSIWFSAAPLGNNNNSVRDPLPVVPGIVFDEKRYITGSKTKVGESPFFSFFLLRIPRNLHLVLQTQVTRELEGDVTRDDSQRRFWAQHRVAALLQRCFEWLQHRSSIATPCRAKNRRCESSRVTSPWDLGTRTSTSARFNLKFLRVFKKKTHRKASFYFFFFFTKKVSTVICTEGNLR